VSGKNSSAAVIEAELFGRYLLGVDPAPELIERYLDAVARLFPSSPAPEDAALLKFVEANPGLLRFVDAAAGLMRPESLLRKKILVMAAIVEASVHHADEFLASPPGPVRTVALLAWHGLSAAIKAAIGAAILAMVPSEESVRA
jgi:hypothetical protein